MLSVQMNTSNFIINEHQNNNSKLPFKDGDTITGILKSKSQNAISVDFSGQQMDIKTQVPITENIGDSITFQVEQNKDNWNLTYKNKQIVEISMPTKKYDSLKQQNSNDINNQETEENDNKLTIYNYNEKINEAIQTILRSTSRATLENMKKYGYSIHSMSVEMAAKMTKYFQGNNVMPSSQINEYIENQVQKFEDTFNNEENLAKSIEVLSNEGLLVTEKNIEQMISFNNKIDQLGDLDREGIIELIKTEKPITVENAYKSIYSGGAIKEPESLTIPDSLIEDHLQKIGYESDPKVTNISKTLIANDVPLTKDNIENYQNLMGIKNIIENKQDLLKTGAKLIKEGQSPGQALLFQENDAPPLNGEQIKDIIEKLPALSTGHIDHLLKQGKEINLKNLIEVKEVNLDNYVPSIDEVKTLTYKRQLNEVRLKMTLEVAHKLNEEGIKIDTASLSGLVDSLRDQEQKHYSSQLDIAGAKVTPDNVNKLDRLYTSINNIKNNIEVSIGAVHKNEAPFTIEGMDKVASEAMKMYDALGTKSDASLGDGFHKVANQISPLLENQNITPSDQNIRSASILIKNQIDLTIENLEAVEVLDKKVSEVINNLHPQVAANMIKENLNPMTMHIDELRDYMNSFNDIYGENLQDKVAKIISQMDKNKELTKEERQGIVSTYRMLHAIDKNKGQAVGFLMKENLEVTLGNLLEASKYFKSTGLKTNKFDAGIDDSFGVVDNIKMKDNKISENIKNALEASNKQFLIENQIDDFVKELMADVEESLNINGEELDDQAIEELTNINKGLIEKLTGYSIKPTLDNLKSVKEMIENPYQLTDELNSLNSFLEENGLEISFEENLEKFNENTTSEELLEDIQEKMEDIEDKIIGTDSTHIAEILNKAEAIGKMAAIQKQIQSIEDVYQIPIYFNGEITNLNMYVLNDREANSSYEYDKPFTAVLAIKTANMGIVQGKITIHGDTVNVQIDTEKQEDRQYIEGFEKTLKDYISKTGFSIGGMDFSTREDSATSNVSQNMKPANIYSQSNIEVLV